MRDSVAFSKEPIKLSVVIRCRNEEENLKTVLQALKAQKCSFLWEVIVVDNESEDNSREVAGRFGAKIISIGKKEFSYGRALNRGIAAAQGSLILLLSAHALPIGSFFLEAATTPFKNPQVAATRCLSVSDWRQIEYWYQPKEIHFVSLEEQKKAEREEAWWVRYPVATCCVIRKSVWDEVRYDEEIEFDEDKFWASKILSRGHKILCCSEALWMNIKEYSKAEMIKRSVSHHVSMYRKTGVAPLPLRKFLFLMLKTLLLFPFAGIPYLIRETRKNFYLLTVPQRAKKAYKPGSLAGFDIKESRGGKS